eukprot:CAMPEP_0184872062 /NCGR_PEP_ID=MMETSP0580-20130426/41073_1 /TAXON_ID=1118495 /ORGANISM="Dactyliosolen fragilissimus" /LENGTH=242 /DNA_ID=CAMNT_0027374803 /DNA_START=482 /DNA_END=1210 /DNA_ORIENTATION=+
MTKKLGGTVNGIVLWPLGGFSICGTTQGGAKSDFLVAIAGPLMHLPMMGLWAGLAAASGDMKTFGTRSISRNFIDDGFAEFFYTFSRECFWVNVFIFAFNLFLPAYPLDGGRCLGALLIMFGLDKTKAAKITAWVGILTSIALLIWGVWVWLSDKSILFFQFLVSIFIIYSSTNLYNLASSGRIDDDPIFGRSCYNSQNATNQNNTEQTNNVNTATNSNQSQESRDQEMTPVPVVANVAEII